MLVNSVVSLCFLQPVLAPLAPQVSYSVFAWFFILVSLVFHTTQLEKLYYYFCGGCYSATNCVGSEQVMLSKLLPLSCIILKRNYWVYTLFYFILFVFYYIFCFFFNDGLWSAATIKFLLVLVGNTASGRWLNYQSRIFLLKLLYSPFFYIYNSNCFF